MSLLFAEAPGLEEPLAAGGAVEGGEQVAPEKEHEHGEGRR
jgi:hypothetical protein